MERHLEMTVFRIQIIALQANLTARVAHTLTYMGSVYI